MLKVVRQKETVVRELREVDDTRIYACQNSAGSIYVASRYGYEQYAFKYMGDNRCFGFGVQNTLREAVERVMDSCDVYEFADVRELIAWMQKVTCD